MAYRFVWWALCGVIGTIGVALGLIVMPIEALISVGLLAVVAALTTWLGYEPPPGDAAPRWRQTRGQAVLFAVTGCVVIVAIAGLDFVLGGGGVFFVLVMLGATCPAAMRRCGRELRRTLSEPDGGQGRSMVTTAQLCREWHESYEALDRAATSAARLRIVMARQRCLDELERRDPDGLHAWLGSSASAGGDPSRFLASNGPDDAPLADI